MKIKPELQVGQTIYVESLGWLNNEPREPKEYEITKINTKSIYAKLKGSNHEQRFDKKTWTAKTALTTEYIWLRREDYWNKIKQIEYKEALRSKIAKELPRLTLEQLQSVEKALKTIQTKEIKG